MTELKLFSPSPLDFQSAANTPKALTHSYEQHPGRLFGRPFAFFSLAVLVRQISYCPNESIEGGPSQVVKRRAAPESPTTITIRQLRVAGNA
jgi:hypothetical protein